ncbi:MAG: C25 family cysteine peptidase, partial [Promethearchaeota archaeon]
MKKVYSITVISFIFIWSFIDAYSQISSNQVTEMENGYILNLSFEKQLFKLEGKNGEVVNYYNSLDESKPGSPILPSKTFIIAIPPESKIRFEMVDKTIKRLKSVMPKSNPSIKLASDSTLVYNETKIIPDYLATDFYPSEEVQLEGYTWIRDYYCAIIRINTHRYNWKKREIIELNKAKIRLDFYNLKPFTVNNEPIGAFDSMLDKVILNYQQAAKLRSFKAGFAADDSTGDWIDFNAEYLKLGVAADGVYRLFKSDLEDYEINVGNIDPRTFKFFYKGSEIPIFVFGEDDGSFDGMDFIEFYGTMNYGSTNYRESNSIGEPFTEYVDRYSDTTIYWLTWGSDLGSRIDTSSFVGASFQDTVTYYTEISHFENNRFLDFFVKNLVEWQNPEWIRNETWFWGGQNVGTGNRNFSISQLVANDSAQAFFRALSYASDKPGDEDAHNLGLRINSDPTVYDSGYIDKYSQKVLTAKFSTDLLQNGNNQLKTISFPVPESEINTIVRDWYEIEYPRYIYLNDDSLKIRFNQDMVNKLYGVRVQNASESNQYIIYKIGGIEKRIEHYLKNINELFFLDSVQAGDSYYITSDGKIHKPKIYYKKQFQNLRDSNIQADYLLITHPYFQEEAVNYINFIGENYEITTKLVDVLDIYDQFNYGFFKPEPVRDFLFQANQLWTNPKPSYVFLVGEANYDYHNYRLIEDYIPNYVPSFGHPVSDNWYVIWDSTATAPQMFIGRLAVNSKEELIHYLNKHSGYLTQPYNNWNKTYFLLSGGFGESEKLIAKSVNDFLIPNYIQPSPVGGYSSQLYATENPLTNFGPFSQAYIDSVFDTGGIVVSYIGHSGTKIWDNGIEDVNQLKNKFNKYPLINDFG